MTPGQRADNPYLTNSPTAWRVRIRVLDQQGQPAHVESATIESDLTERLSDHRLVGTRDDVGVEEVAVPHPDAELLLVVLAEPAPVLLILDQRIPLYVVA